VLVLAFNQMTRLADLLGSGDKVYQGRLSLGAATDTGDPTGEVVETGPATEPDEAAARAALAALEGERLQSPPAYSAAKHKGRPLYAYARQGRKVEKPARPITVHRARLLGLAPEGLDFELVVSRGTYVRSLAEDLARSLGTVGHLASLCRTASRPFVAGGAVGLHEALEMGPEELAASLWSPSEALAACGLPEARLDDDAAWRLRQGSFLERAELMPAAGRAEPGQAFRVLDAEGGLVAVLRWFAPGQAKPGRDYETIRVFPERPTGSPAKEASASAMGAE
jgi:tRNA pseudouridine55 synthase